MSIISPHQRTMLETLARLYSESAAGQRGAGRDFTVEREKFLHEAGASDGDARELAEEFLAGIERISIGTVLADRHGRSGEIESLRVRRDGGEAWLFSALGQPSPSAKRAELANWFQDLAQQVPNSVSPARWSAVFMNFAELARSGASVQPFVRNAPALNAQLLKALYGVLGWKGTSLVRYASAVICGDSKLLQALAPRLEPLLGNIAGSGNFEDFGILSKPRLVAVHGPFELECAGNRLDFSPLPGATLLSETTLLHASRLFSNAPCCLTVENDDAFLELCKLQTGVVLVHTSYPGAATRAFLQKLPPSLPRYHFGDTDPAGFDILRDLREKSGLPVSPLQMNPDFSPVEDEGYRPYTTQEIQILTRLVENPIMADLAGLLKQMIDRGGKSRYEQELLPLRDVSTALRQAACRDREKSCHPPNEPNP